MNATQSSRVLCLRGHETLSPGELKMLSAIDTYRLKHGRCPSIQDLMTVFGMKGPHWIHRLIVSLKEKGLVEQQGNRTLTVRCKLEKL